MTTTPASGIVATPPSICRWLALGLAAAAFPADHPWRKAALMELWLEFTVCRVNARPPI